MVASSQAVAASAAPFNVFRFGPLQLVGLDQLSTLFDKLPPGDEPVERISLLGEIHWSDYHTTRQLRSFLKSWEVETGLSKEDVASRVKQDEPPGPLNTIRDILFLRADFQNLGLFNFLDADRRDAADQLDAAVAKNQYCPKVKDFVQRIDLVYYLVLRGERLLMLQYPDAEETFIEEAKEACDWDKETLKERLDDDKARQDDSRLRAAILLGKITGAWLEHTYEKKISPDSWIQSFRTNENEDRWTSSFVKKIFSHSEDTARAGIIGWNEYCGIEQTQTELDAAIERARKIVPTLRQLVPGRARRERAFKRSRGRRTKYVKKMQKDAKLHNRRRHVR